MPSSEATIPFHAKKRRLSRRSSRRRIWRPLPALWRGVPVPAGGATRRTSVSCTSAARPALCSDAAPPSPADPLHSALLPPIYSGTATAELPLHSCGPFRFIVLALRWPPASTTPSPTAYLDELRAPSKQKQFFGNFITIPRCSGANIKA